MLLSRGQIPKNTYDVIVVGGGLGGLTAANILGRNGQRVLLLEAHNKLGGLATWFYRHDHQHLFDVSLHGFPHGMVKSMRKYWGSHISDYIVPIKEVTFSNPQYRLSSSFDQKDYISILCNHFKLDPDAVNTFFHDLKNLKFYDKTNETIGEFFQKYFPNRNDVTRFILEPMTYANGSTLEDPIVSFAIVFLNFMKKGVYTFKGSTFDFIAMLKKELLKNNVDIKMNCEVSKILVENNKVQGVKTSQGHILSKTVISNAHLFHTINNLLDNRPEIIKDKIKMVKNNTSSAQVYFGLKEKANLPYFGELFFTSKALRFSTQELLHRKTTSRTYSFYYAQKRGIQCSRSAIVSSTNAIFSDWDKLDKEEYKRAKQQLIDDTIEDLSEYIPNIKELIEIVDAATPLTIKKYTRHTQGSSFGTKFEGLEVSRSLPKHINGLFHCGSVGIIMSGWLGAANYGAIVANDVSSLLYKGS